ncbi:hypothetical protein DFP73DRAFT_598240 [Morchella snyderi]|nr:hypothetical protein DFP73DRAFT_598240 [Morchella snyderi]
MKRRGFLEQAASPKRAARASARSRATEASGSQGTQHQSIRQGSVLESDLFGIPLSVWEDDNTAKTPDKTHPTTVVNRETDKADIELPPQLDEREALRPASSNLLGVNFNDAFIGSSSDNELDSEDEDKENRDYRMVDQIDDDDGEITIGEKGAVTQSIEETVPPQEARQEPIPELEGDGVEYIADGPSPKKFVLEDFHLALMMFTITADISTNQYTALVEILALATPLAISTLPKSIKTLRERYRNAFPLSVIKGKEVAIDPESTPPKSHNPKKAYYFDASEYCKIWLSSPKLKIHQGMGHIVDNVSELWQGDAWMESVRTTSGEFAYINEAVPGEQETQRTVLLPSDCVIYNAPEGGLALGRVKCVGVDRRVIMGTMSNTVSAIINRLVPPTILPAQWAYHDEEARVTDKSLPAYHLGHSTLQELVLLESREIIPCVNIRSRVWVFFADYASEEELRQSLLPQPARYCVRSIAYYTTRDKRPLIRSIHMRHRVAAENELLELGREYVLQNMVNVPVNPNAPNNPDRIRRVSVPFSLFLDGFGLYRNAYHSIKGMYITPAGLDVYQRERLSNVYVLMLGPFGSSEVEMASCLERDGIETGRGKSIKLYTGETIFLTAFPLLFTGDMPQQNQNSGNKTHQAEFGCRSCMVIDKDRGNLNVEIVGTGRYMAPTQRFYLHALDLKTKKARDAALQSRGLTLEGPYFKKCYRMLDPQRANPNDCMHAELRLAKYLEEALLDGILSPAGISAYREAWNDVEMPYKWGQPQNPVKHKGSMVFNEHGRVAIVNPFVLMHMFTNDRWKHTSSISQRERDKLRISYVKKGVYTRLEQTFEHETISGMNPKLQFIRVAYALAKTINLTLKETLTSTDRSNFSNVVWEMRDLLRKIFACATGNDTTFKNYANVPNIHLGLHYEQDITNFGTTRNSTTTMGEQKHKIFKIHAPNTNSKDNDLQLMKMTNTVQTLRFMLEGAFENELQAGIIASKVKSIVKQCSTLKTFLGQTSGMEQLNDWSCMGIEEMQSLLAGTRTGKPIALKSYNSKDREDDINAIVQIYRTQYGIYLATGMKFKIGYWGYVAGEPRTDIGIAGKLRRFRLKINHFVKLRGNPTFYRVKRMLTTTMGNMVRLFFVLDILQRLQEEELAMIPYMVLQAMGESIVVPLEKIEPISLHFVTKGEGVWWCNPYVPHFG